MFLSRLSWFYVAGIGLLMIAGASKKSQGKNPLHKVFDLVHILGR